MTNSDLRSDDNMSWTGGLPETPCGRGSTVQQTARQRAWLERVIDRYGIKSIADIGAGDLNWITHLNLKGIDYQPFDLIPRNERVKQLDIRQTIPPEVDCLLCLWVLNHMELEDANRAYKNLTASKSRFLVITDRPKLRGYQPIELAGQAIDALLLNDKGDRIKLFRL